jgi:hypothetical protein
VAPAEGAAAALAVVAVVLPAGARTLCVGAPVPDPPGPEPDDPVPEPDDAVPDDPLPEAEEPLPDPDEAAPEGALPDPVDAPLDALPEPAAAAPDPLDALPEPAAAAPDPLAVAGNPSLASRASCVCAEASALLSAASCCASVVTVCLACWRLIVFASRCAAVSPLSALASALRAVARLALADASVLRALVGSIVAIAWPARTCSPGTTSTAVIVPLVAKFADADCATATLPEALTLESTVPRLTVAVRRDPAPLDAPAVKP